MKLIKFWIQNYKSIKDTGWCWLASDLTTLAGKNESGKSAVLEALRDFNINVDKIPGEALPLEDNSKPLIEMCFEVAKPMLDEIAQKTGVTIGKEVRNYIAQSGFTISKHYDGSYGLKDEINKALDKQVNNVNQQYIVKIEKEIKELSKIEQLANVMKPTFVGSIDLDKQDVTRYIQQIQVQVAPITTDEEKKQIADKIEELKEKIML